MAEFVSGPQHNGSGPTGPGFDLVMYNHDIEIALIGAVIIHGPPALEYLADVEAADFSPDNGTLWNAVKNIAAQDLRPDPALVADELGPIFIEGLGGRHALTCRYLDAQAAAPVLTSVTRHADILRRTAQSRRLQATAFELAMNATNGQVDELVDDWTSFAPTAGPNGSPSPQPPTWN